MINCAIAASPYQVTQKQGQNVAFSGKKDVLKKAAKAVLKDKDRCNHLGYHLLVSLLQCPILVKEPSLILTFKLINDSVETVVELIKDRNVSSLKQPLNVVVHAGEIMYLQVRGIRALCNKVKKQK
jgi:hypothetical protein